MKRLHLLILRSFFGPFILIFFIVLFVLLMQFLWRYIDELIGKGLEFKTILEFLLYTSATLVPMALPLSILMSSLMTFGNLGEKYELTAIKASGISLQRIMKPLIIVVLFISIGTFFFANNVLPYANLQMRSLLYDIRQQRPELQIKPGQFNNLIDGYSIRVDKKDPKTNTMYTIQIYDHSNADEQRELGNASVTIADSGTMKMTPDEQYLLLTLYSGHSYTEMQKTNVSEKKRSYPHRYNKFEKRELLIELTGFGLERTDQNLFKNHYAMMSLSQLAYTIDSVKEEVYEKEDRVYGTLVNLNLFKKRQSRKRTSSSDAVKIIDPALKSTIQQINKPDIPGNDKSKTNSESSITSTGINEELVKEESTGLVVDIDSIFNILTLREKARAANLALSYSRNSKNTISNSFQTIDYQVGNLRRYEVEWHRKFALAFACLVFLFIGAPLGAIIRKGGLGLPLVLSVLFFILYYILSLTGEKLVRESIMPAWRGMWLTSVIFSIAGAFLTYQATTDSSMLNLDTYLNFLKRYFGQRYNVVDTISIDTEESKEGQAKLEKIQSSIVSLNESIDELMDTIKSYFRLFDFLGSLFSVQNDSKIILFDRYYNNTFRILINHSIFHEKTVRAKVYEFPSFSQEEFGDKKWKLILRIILAFTIVLAPIVAVRQYIKLLFIRIKLRKIKSLLPELSSIIKRYESEP